MIEPSKKLQAIFENAIATAKHHTHEFITLEHIIYSSVCDTETCAILDAVGADTNYLKSSLTQYINTGLDNIKTNLSTTSPRKTNSVERALNRCFSQVLFGGRDTIEVTDIIISILSEKNSFSYFYLTKAGVAKDKFIKFINNSSKENSATANESQGESSEITEAVATKVIDKYCTNLTLAAKQKKIDPVIGRDEELEKIQLVLARRSKSNVLLVGDPGVGKTAIAEGLARKIFEKKVPEFIKGYTVYNLDISSLLSGAKFRGDFEERVKSLFAALEVKGKVIVFIDEAHMMNGAGSSTNNANDFSNMIKPLLTKGTIKLIASTTWDEYRKHFEQDRALMRRFQRITVDEPSAALAVKIIKGVRKYYEKHHCVKITDAAIEQSVKLSVKYMADKKLPDKAIDIIDCAAARYTIKDDPATVGIPQIVDVEQVMFELSKMLSMPIETLSSKDSKNLADLEKSMKKVVYGQDSAIDTLLDKVFVAQAGMKHPNKPIGSFLFTGPTGTGKTETARMLAEKMGMSFVRFDMSEYQERHSISRLIGSPPGYVGFDNNAGQLITKLQENPNCVLLLDEIEKSHPDVSNIFLQYMDNGFVTGSNGKQADGRNCILIMTSNLGAADNEKNTIGFGGLDKDGEDDKAVKQFFAPEFRNRLDAIVKFSSLTQTVVYEIVKKFISELNDQLKDKHITIVPDSAALKWLAEKGYDRKMGARPLARVVDKEIKSALSRRILFGDLAAGGKVWVSVEDGLLVFTVEPLVAKVLNKLPAVQLDTID